MLFRLKIEGPETTYTPWAHEETAYVLYAVEQARFAYPTAAISVERKTGAPPANNNNGGSFRLISDPTPTLSGDLNLAGHGVVGSLENQTLILDGGLLG